MSSVGFGQGEYKHGFEKIGFFSLGVGTYEYVDPRLRRQFEFRVIPVVA